MHKNFTLIRGLEFCCYYFFFLVCLAHIYDGELRQFFMAECKGKMRAKNGQNSLTANYKNKETRKGLCCSDLGAQRKS